MDIFESIRQPEPHWTWTQVFLSSGFLLGLAFGSFLGACIMRWS